MNPFEWLSWPLLGTLCALAAAGGAQERTGNGSDADALPTKCYDRWGCINMGAPFVSLYRPVNLYPAHPDVMEIRFFLRTRQQPDYPLLLRNVSDLEREDFGPRRPTFIIIHGYLEHGRDRWIQDMSRELLTRGDFNVFAMDWALGAVPPYAQACANARMAGRVLADFISQLAEQDGFDVAQLHLIGHSLGAHVAGYAGEATPNLGRITGLDPAEPYFQYTDQEVRLDPSDASFVDVIHTDGGSIIVGGLGMIQDCGHVDFYPNGGKRQPGCHGSLGSISRNGDFFHGLRRYISCNHIRAYELFTESINSECPFLGFECDSYANFTAGRCVSGCGNPESPTCARMGYRASEFQPFATADPTKMFLQTGNISPYCRFHYLVQISLAESRKMNGSEKNTAQGIPPERGRLFLRLTGSRGQSSILEASRDYIQFVPGTSTDFLVTAPNLGQLLRADIEWKSATSLLNPLSWHFFTPPHITMTGLTVTSLETGDRTTFPGREEPLKAAQVRTFFAESSNLP